MRIEIMSSVDVIGFFDPDSADLEAVPWSDDRPEADYELALARFLRERQRGSLALWKVGDQCGGSWSIEVSVSGNCPPGARELEFAFFSKGGTVRFAGWSHFITSAFGGRPRVSDERSPKIDVPPGWHRVRVVQYRRTHRHRRSADFCVTFEPTKRELLEEARTCDCAISWKSEPAPDDA